MYVCASGPWIESNDFANVNNDGGRQATDHADSVAV